MKKKLTAILLGMLMSATLFSVNVSALEGLALSDKYNVEYRTHVQDYGWETTWRSNGSLSGTVGESKRLEALEVKLTGAGLPVGAVIQTYVHVQNEGDLGPFAMGKMAGTEGKGQRLERITMNLINLPDHQLRYNVQVQNIGWLRDENDVSTWFVGGESAGTSGRGLRLEGIKIALIETNEAYEAYEKALAAVKEENYTTSSWQYYQALVEIYAVTADNTKAEIEEATKEVQAAQKNLVKASDMSVYKAVLASVKEADYTPESWEVYQQVVSDNYVTKDDSQTVINAAIKKIQEAQKLLQRKINLTEYFEVIGSALESDYMPESWAEYQQVLAQNIVTAANSQTEINAAVKNIIEAQKKMVRRLDFTGYNSLLKAVKEEDYTTESWLIYQDVVNANVMTENNTQSEVAKAMESIEAAQKKLVKNADLSAYDAALIAVLEDDYTPASWLIYQNVVKANKVTAANGQVAIDAATQKILDAQLKLVKKGDFTAYEAALAAVNPDDYTPLSWATYQKVVTANRASGAATQDTIDKATDKILVAQLNLVKKGDMINYKNALDAVKEINYTVASWTEYQKVVKANPVTINSTQEVIDLATENIISAQDKLEFKNGDIRAYETALTKVKEADYTNASWKIYQKVVQANVVDGENKQTEIDQATKNIQAAQGALVRKGSLTEYNIALAGLDESDYTAVSWKAYQNVVKANIRTAEDTQAIIDLSTTKILAAQKSLVKVGDLTAYEAALAAVRKENYTTATWNDYQLVVKANVRTKNEAQLVIDGSVKKILAAQKLLVRKYDISAYNALLAAVKQADYIPASWTAYQTVVKAYPASYSPIQTAIEKIEAAQAKLVKKVDLTAYKKALAAVKEAEYVPATWVAYMKVVNANVVDETNTQTQIDEATKKIIEAQKNLKRKVNLTLYLELLEGVIEYDYSPTSWVIYQKVLADNVVTENNTQTEVDAATEKIRVAQNKLVRRLDYTRYQELVDAMKDKEDQYTSVSWGLYDKVIKDNTLKKDQSETQTQIDKAVANIEAAQKKLVKAGDLTAYNLVLAAVKREDYTTASWDVYLKVLEANEMSKNHSQAEIDVATDKIRLAQLKLAKAATDMDEYNELIGLQPVDYTSVSWAIYQKVLDANYVTAQDGQIKINAAVVKLREAKRKLVLRAENYDEYNKVLKYNLYLGSDPDAPDLTKPPLLMNEGEYTTSSWAVYQKVLDANTMDLDKSQVQVNTAVANIKKAQFKLLKGGLLTRYNNLLKYNVILGKDPDVTTDIRPLREMKETEYTSATWAVYSKVLSSNEMDRDKSQAQIDAAVVKIERAQMKLAEKGDVTKYNETLATNKAKTPNVPMQEADYTEKSWLVYEKLLASKGYFVTSDNSQAEIDKAIELVIAAQRNLKIKGDLTKFRAAIENPEYFGKEDKFTTLTWNEYLAVLKKYNAISSEDTQLKIDLATTDITNAQARLKLGADMAEYNTIKGRVNEADYTTTSWGAYFKIVSANTVTKDDTQTKVNAAKTAIETAQLKLVRANDTEMAAFKETLELYQRNIINPGTIKAKATDTTWEIYEKAVLANANFKEVTGDWIPTKITKDTAPADIIAATKDIDAAIRQLRPKPETGLDVGAYLTAIDTLTVPFDGSAGTEIYTKSSYADYVKFYYDNNIPIRNLIETTPGKINTATAMIPIGKDLLKFAASGDEIKAFNDEIKISESLRTKESDFTSTSFGEYRTAYLKYSLKPEVDDKIAYTTATAVLQGERVGSLAGEREGLIYKATIVKDKANITSDRLALNVGDNLISEVKRLMNTEMNTYINSGGSLVVFDQTKYTVTIVQTVDVGATAVIDTVKTSGSYGVITSKGNGKAKVTITIKSKDSDDVSTVTDLTVTIGAMLTAGTLADATLNGEFTGGNDIASSSALTVSVPTANKTNATLALTKGNADATVKYVKTTAAAPAPADDTVYTVDLSTTPGIAGDLVTGDIIWLLVTAQDGTTKKYYKITVTVNP